MVPPILNLKTDIPGLNRTDRVYESAGAKLIKIRLVPLDTLTNLQDNGALGTVQISGAIVDAAGKAKLRSGVTPEMVAAARVERGLAPEDSDPAEFYLVNQTHTVTIQRSNEPGFSPSAAVEEIIAGQIESTAVLEDQVGALDTFLTDWEGPE